jgi:hypothetical protein
VTALWRLECASATEIAVVAKRLQVFMCVAHEDENHAKVGVRAALASMTIPAFD